mgnify:CR=1 FL=1
MLLILIGRMYLLLLNIIGDMKYAILNNSWKDLID